METCKFCNKLKNPECDCLDIVECVYCEQPQDECECESE